MSVVAALLLIGLALPSYAQTDEQQPVDSVAAEVSTPTVLITEVQTAGQTASDEFIELYNAGGSAAAIGGWQVRYMNAGAQDETMLVATIADGVMLPAQAYYVLHAPSVVLPANVLGQQYTATLSNKDKVIGLFARDQAHCRLGVHDAVAWGTSVQGEGQAVVVSDSDAPKHLFRYHATTDGYIDTNTNVHDIGISTTMPFVTSVGGSNGQHSPASDESAWPAKGPGSPLSPVAIKDCGVPPADSPEAPAPSVPQLPPSSSPPVVVAPDEEEPPARPTIPEGNIGLLAPQISELLPNPAKPQTDAHDEFIELYNPNATRFELSGFMLEVGSKTKKRFTFPDGVMLAPKSFTAFTSADTNLALSNTQGQVWLLDPLGRVIGQSDAYQSAKDGHVWLSADGTWQWSTIPTPNAINIVKKPAAKKTVAATTAAKSQATASVKSAATTHADKPTVANEKTAGNKHEDNSFSPLHPGILALTGVLAVLYAVYEYRRDLANKFHQFRANRAARRNLGQNTKGR